MVIFRIFVILFFIFSSKSVLAAVITTKIKSDFIDIKRHDEVVYLNGNVVVEREDFNILADHMKIYYDENSKKDGENDIDEVKNQSSIEHSSIKKIIANDNIKIFNQDFVATGNNGSYDPKEENFILENNVVLNRGLSTAHGEKFIYNLKTKKGNLIGEKIKEKKETTDGRVTVIIDDSNIKNKDKKNNE